MFGLNENTQYYVCQRYVRMNMGSKRLRVYTLHNSKKAVTAD